EPDAISLPSGLTATASTSRVWPVPGVPSRPTSSHSLSVLSTLAETRNGPLGLKATELTQFLWPRKVYSACLVSRSQTLMTVFAPPETSSRPSALKATELTGPVCPASTTGGSSGSPGAPLLVAIVQTRTLPSLPSLPHEARRRPSGLKATALTAA